MSAYQHLAQRRKQAPIRQRCRVLQVAPSAYYAWQQRHQVPALEPAGQLVVRQAFARYGRRYGIRRLRAERQAEGHSVGRGRIRRTLAGAHVATAASAPVLDALGSRWQVLVTAAQTEGIYSAVLCTLPAGSEVPEQVHAQDEGLYVLSGTLRAQLGGQPLPAQAESFVFIPAGCAQQLTAVDKVQLLLFLVPGGYEQVLQNVAVGPGT